MGAVLATRKALVGVHWKSPGPLPLQMIFDELNSAFQRYCGPVLQRQIAPELGGRDLSALSKYNSQSPEASVCLLCALESLYKQT